MKIGLLNAYLPKDEDSFITELQQITIFEKNELAILRLYEELASTENTQYRKFAETLFTWKPELKEESRKRIARFFSIDEYTKKEYRKRSEYDDPRVAIRPSVLL